jgi:uncharacterized phage-associated protein
MEELKDVILHVLKTAGPRSVGRTVLVKLVYFAELESWRSRGRPLTGTPFRLYHYGAYAPEVHFVAEAMPELVTHRRLAGFDWPEHTYSINEEASPPAIDEDVRQIIERVTRQYASMTAKTIGALSKETEPVKCAEEGKRLDLSIVAPPEMRVRVTDEGVLSAASRLDTSVRGTAEERQKLEREELEALKPARTRAWANLDTTP